MSRRRHSVQRYIPNNSPPFTGESLEPHHSEAERLQISSSSREQIVAYINKAISSLITSPDQHVSRDFSLYTGTGGICYLFLHLTGIFKNSEEISSQYLAWAERYYQDAQVGLERSIEKGGRSADRISFVTGKTGVYGMGVLLGALKGDTAMVDECTSAIVEMKDMVVQGNQDNEILYGRAGYLYSLLWGRRYAGAEKVPDSVIAEVVDKLFEEGQAFREFRNMLMYKWCDTLYLGGAHGVTGILVILLLALEEIHGLAHLRQAIQAQPSGQRSQLEEQLALIQATVEYLISQMNERGNLPSRADAPERSVDDELVQWCHGAPGMVQTLIAAYHVFEEPRYLEYADAAARCIWEKGILTKGNSLCHGTGGNAYNFLQLYQVTDNSEYLYYAQQFALACISDDVKRFQRTPDRPLSLFEGLAGELFFLSDISFRPLEGKFPCVF